MEEDVMFRTCSRHRVYVKFLNKIMVGVPEGKRPIRRHKYRREENIKMDFTGMVCGVVVRIQLAQDTVH
jgi:hypothetical protein